MHQLNINMLRKYWIRQSKIIVGISASYSIHSIDVNGTSGGCETYKGDGVYVGISAGGD